jgi:hypothetical protein
MEIIINGKTERVPFCYESKNDKQLNCESTSCIHRRECLSTIEGIKNRRNYGGISAYDSARFKQNNR